MNIYKKKKTIPTVDSQREERAGVCDGKHAEQRQNDTADHVMHFATRGEKRTEKNTNARRRRRRVCVRR